MKFDQLIFGILSIFVVLQSCSSNPTNNSNPQLIDKPTHTTTATPVAVVRGFLAWYTKNQGSLEPVPVVPASVDDDTSNVYAVDFKAAQQYLNILINSGYLSDNYLAEEQSLISAADSAMKANPQTDGPPPGFDYDHIVHSQDAENDLKLLARTIPIVKIRTDSARVLFPQLPNEPREGAELAFDLTQHSGKWLIDSITPIFAPN